MLERDQFTEDGDQSDRRFTCDRCGKEGDVFLESELVEQVIMEVPYKEWRIETADNPDDPQAEDLCPTCYALRCNHGVGA